MKKFINVAAVAAAFAFVFAASPVLAAPPEKTEGFVCPVITTDAVLNSPRGAVIGEGHYSIIGPNVSVPIHATNDEGAGVPGGPHAAPGDANYSAIWAGQ